MNQGRAFVRNAFAGRIFAGFNSFIRKAWEPAERLIGRIV
jgi:hypothetical protein